MKFNLFLLFLIINSIAVLAAPSLLTKRDCADKCEDCGLICCSNDVTCMDLVGASSAYCDFTEKTCGDSCGVCKN